MFSIQFLEPVRQEITDKGRGAVEKRTQAFQA